MAASPFQSTERTQANCYVFALLKEARSWAAKKKVSKREQLYLDALGALYDESGGGKSGMSGFVDGLETIVQEFPDDLDAPSWLVLALYLRDSVGSRQTADAMLDSVLRVEPMHPGAHQYRIHLWDQHKPTRANGSAEAYASAAPGIAHAWHMPGHTYTELKRYADAAYHQEAAARVDHAAMVRDHIMPFEIHNYVHNNQWLCTSLSHVGRARDAIAVARNLVELPRDPDKNTARDGSAQRNGRLRWVEVLIRYELWDDLIGATTSGALDWSDVPFEQMMRAYSLGLAYAALGDRPKLAGEIATLRKLVSQRTNGPTDGRAMVRLEVAASPGADPAEIAKQVSAKLKAAEARPRDGATGGPRTIVRESPAGTPGSAGDGAGITIELALAELEGHELLLAGDVGAAFVKFSRAPAMRPEARARAHLGVRNYAFAETTAKLGVERAPGQVSQLAAYVEVLHAVGKDKEALVAYRTLETLAREADHDLPVFRRLAKIGALGVHSPLAGSATDPSDSGPPHRIDPSTLGPLTWSPYAAPAFSCPDSNGKLWNLSEHRGRVVVVLLYLGGRFAHCMQQLLVFGKMTEEWKSLGVDLVGVSTDDARATKALRGNDDNVKFPMPLLADPELIVFRSYRCYDDFESQPLHGVFLTDARGNVRYQRVSADPFLDVDFIRSEIERVRRSSF